MASADNPEIREARDEVSGPGTGSEFEVEDLDKLESDIKQMAEKISEYRANLPDQLMSTLVSILSAQRPVMPDVENGSGLGPSGDQNPGSEGQIGSSRGASPVPETKKDVDKLSLLKEKISSNISAMPIVIKRMKHCIAAIETLDSSNETIDPAFKRKGTQ